MTYIDPNPDPKLCPHCKQRLPEHMLKRTADTTAERQPDGSVLIRFNPRRKIGRRMR